MVRFILSAALLFSVAAGLAVAEETERIEGVVIAVHQNDFVLDGDGRRVVVDMSALGGVTAAIAERQPVAVIGKMASDGQRFIAQRLEAVKSRTSGQR